jgi:hypothetical protein
LSPACGAFKSDSLKLINACLPMSGPIATVLPDANALAFALGAATNDSRRVPGAAFASNQGAGKTSFETRARNDARPDESLNCRTSSIGDTGANFASPS